MGRCSPGESSVLLHAHEKKQTSQQSLDGSYELVSSHEQENLRQFLAGICKVLLVFFLEYLNYMYTVH